MTGLTFEDDYNVKLNMFFLFCLFIYSDSVDLNMQLLIFYVSFGIVSQYVVWLFILLQSVEHLPAICFFMSKVLTH